ncbi:ABC transporter substrate-binding protein [Paenibacillus artemisiicola]|nr:ABC transporter substrate-binding protein [Paenibacillus artemisiicola]
MGLALALAVMLAGCGANGQSNGTAAADKPANGNAAAPENGQARTAGEKAAKNYTDAKGREVEVPVDPRRIVYVGSDPGDLLALGVQPLGASLSVIASQVAYPDLLAGIEDVGYPANTEKVLALAPDLILFSDWDEKALEPLAKIAPTVVMGGDGTFERMGQFAELLGRQQEAAAYKADYDAKADQVKERLKDRIKPGTTATVLLQLGKDLYVMGHQGLSVSLYDMLDLKPSGGVKQLIDKDERFSLVSEEVLPSFAGDELYVLTDEAEETATATKALLGSRVWSTIPAVRNGRVTVMNSRWNFDDPVTRERLLDELGKVMAEKAE